MGMSGISTATTVPVQHQTQLAPDGDTPAVEARETRAAKLAEAQNGGFAPKAANATTQAFNTAEGKGTIFEAIA